MFPMIAGSDTAAKAIRNVVEGALSSPEILREFLHEIDAAALDGRISEPITDKEARNLPFLQVSLRMDIV